MGLRILWTVTLLTKLWISMRIKQKQMLRSVNFVRYTKMNIKITFLIRSWDWKVCEISIYLYTPAYPLIIFSGFYGHLDTPFKSLHVILLGILKYIYRDTLSKLSREQQGEVRGFFHSFDTSGLNIPPIQPNTMVRFARSLVGKELRTALQTAPFVLF